MMGNVPQKLTGRQCSRGELPPNFGLLGCKNCGKGPILNLVWLSTHCIRCMGSLLVTDFPHHLRCVLRFTALSYSK